MKYASVLSLLVTSLLVVNNVVKATLRGDSDSSNKNENKNKNENEGALALESGESGLRKKNKNRRLTSMQSAAVGSIESTGPDDAEFGGAGAQTKDAVPFDDEMEHNVCDTPTGTCMNQINYAQCLNFIRDGCQKIAFRSCPYKLECLDWEQPQPQQPQSASSKFYTSSKGKTFKLTLPVFDTDITNTYTSIQQLKDDLFEIAKFHVNAIIEQRLYPVPIPSVFIEFDPIASNEVDASGGSTGTQPSAEGVDDFGTNNQENGIDEADLVKSDGTYVYAAYGDILIVWDADTGTPLLNITMPLPVIPSTDTNTTTTTTTTTKSSIWGGYQPKPQIKALLLHNNRLVIVVAGYDQEVGIASSDQNTSPFFDGINTRVIVYNTSALSTSQQLTLITQKDLQGTFRDARSIGSVVHLVTTSSLDTWNLLERHLNLWNFDGLTTEQYKINATLLAQTELIPNFVETIATAITANNNGAIPNMARISLWQSVLSNATEAIYSGGAINSYTELTSFDMSIPEVNQELTTSAASVFTPSSWGVTYSAGTMLIFAMEGWNFMPEFAGTGQTTYLVGFLLNGATAKPTAVGSVPGFLINQYSLDVQNGYLRAATSIRSIWPMEPLSPVGQAQFWNPEPTTHNQVVILVPTLTGTFNEVSRISGLGKPGEVFTAVRFFENIAYVVTFLRTDPFYVLNLKDPQNPAILGELNITGFSSYLHSINADDSILLGVGEEADNTGRTLGIQISMYNATVPTSPGIMTRFTVETERDVWSSSSVQFDYKAFRYTPLGDNVGVLIMPLRVQSWDSEKSEHNFDGFVVYDIDSANGVISERLSISHVDSDAFFGCYYQAYLPQRSFVFNGNVTTMKAHSVVSTNLDTQQRRWKLEMPQPAVEDYCIYW